MQHDLAAARRLWSLGFEPARARTIINELRPIFRFDAVDSDNFEDLHALAHDLGPRIGRLELKVGNDFIAIATAWPCAPGSNPGERNPTKRFVTAGHVLKYFMISAATLPNVLAIQKREMREGRVVFPGVQGAGVREVAITDWIAASHLDLAVFDVEMECDGLCLGRAERLPQNVATLGYPLRKNVRLYADVDPDYMGKLFAALGETRNSPARIRPSDYFQHDGSTLPGYSGAPVFNPQTRVVVGMHVWGAASVFDVATGQSDFHSASTEDRNHAVLVSSMLARDWMAAILAGESDAPPKDTSVWYWTGGQTPEDALSPAAMAQEILRRMRPSLGPSPPPPDAGISFDRPDSRDRIYDPAIALPAQQVIPRPNVVGDQMNEGSCAAFAVAAAIEHQLAQSPDYAPARHFTASVRMLDRIARRHDEWLDDNTDGTSLRAVIKGLFHNGVCHWDKSPYVPCMTDFFLSRDIAKDARNLTLGGYLRVRNSVNDMRMAVQEGRAVIVSAQVHDGWRHLDADHRIPYASHNPPAPRGLHAFVVDGYTDAGFIVQNARGLLWGGFMGLPGHALWSFDDWAANCHDAWLIRLAPRSEKAFSASIATDTGLSSTRRIGLLGHMLHAERGGLVEDGTLGLGVRGVAETAGYLASDKGRRKYPRLLLIFHEPLLDGDTIARLAQQITLQMKAHGVYPFHIVYGMDEMLGCRLRLHHDVAEAASRYLREGGSRDGALQRKLGPVIRAQIESYRIGAQGAGARVLADALRVFPLFAADGRRIQMVSTGLGVIPACALSRSEQHFALPHLAIAPPVSAPGIKALRLGEQRDERDLPGWLGSWGDLVAAAHDRSIRGRGGAAAPNIQALMERRDFVPELLKQLD